LGLAFSKFYKIRITISSFKECNEKEVKTTLNGVKNLSKKLALKRYRYCLGKNV